MSGIVSTDILHLASGNLLQYALSFRSCNIEVRVLCGVSVQDRRVLLQPLDSPSLYGQTVRSCNRFLQLVDLDSSMRGGQSFCSCSSEWRILQLDIRVLNGRSAHSCNMRVQTFLLGVKKA
jgi:hypothetical protein